MKSSAVRSSFPGQFTHVLDRETISGSAYHYDGNFNLYEAPNWGAVYDAQSRLVYGAHAGNSVFFT